MNIAIFDTLKLSRRLEEAGFSRDQATGMTEALSETIGDELATKHDIDGLRADTKRDIEELRAATKRDIDDLRAATKRDIEDLRTEVKRDLKELEYRLTVRLGGMMAIAVGVMAALVKLL